MKVLESILGVDTKDRLAFVESLQVNSPVAVMTVSFKTTEEIYVDEVFPGGFKLSDGRIFDERGIHDNGHFSSKIIFEPNKETREEYVARKLRGEISSFQWGELTSAQLDAVLKYARAKLEAPNAEVTGLGRNRSNDER